jgi:hypothetical protein
MTKMKMLGASVLALSLITGCSVRSDFTALSSKNVNLASIKVDKSKSKGRAYGEDCMHIIVFIPTKGNITLDEAIDKALESKHANLLLDAKVEISAFYIPYIYGKSCWTAEGDAYDTYK